MEIFFKSDSNVRCRSTIDGSKKRKRKIVAFIIIDNNNKYIYYKDLEDVDL